MDPSLNSFGGHAMDRHIFDLNTDDGAGSGSFDAGGAAAPSPDAAHVAAPDTGATGEPDTSDGATAPAAPPAEPVLNPREVQAELDYLRSQNQQVVEAFQQLIAQGATPAQAHAGAQAVQTGLPDFDPLDADSVRAYNDARDQLMLQQMQQLVGQFAQPFQEQQQQAQQAQLEAHLGEQVNDLMEDNIARHGDFVPGVNPEQQHANQQARALVDTIAATLYPSISQRYGGSPAALEMALTQAADQVRGILRAAGVGAAQQQANQLATLAGARGEPGVGAGAGVQGGIVAKVNGGESLATKYSRMAQNTNAAA